MPPLESTKSSRRLPGGYTPRQVRDALWTVMLAWVFGAAFCSITGGAAFISFLTKYLKASDFSYGLVMAAGPAAVLLQFLGSYMVERTGRVKRPFLIYVTLHRLLWIGMALVALYWSPSAHTSNTLPVLITGVLVFCSAATANYGGAGWAAWMSRIVPKAVAGKYFGFRASLGMWAMIVTTSGIAFLLDRFAGQGWVYAAAFGVGAVLGAIDILLFIPVPEVPREPETTLPTLWDILTTPWQDRVFRGYALYTALSWIIYMMMGPFVWRFCLDPIASQGLGMNVQMTNILLFILPTAAMALVSPLWGQAIDRFGPKPVLATSAVCQIILPLGWVVMRPELFWLIPIQAVLAGFTWPGIDQTFIYMQVKGFPETRRSAYIAALQVVFGLACMIGTAFGGIYADFWNGVFEHAAPTSWLAAHLPVWVSHYHPVFLTSIVLRLLLFMFLLPLIPLPGTARHTAVARAMVGTAVSSLQNVAGLRKRK